MYNAQKTPKRGKKNYNRQIRQVKLFEITCLFEEIVSTIQIFRSDNAVEYNEKSFQNCLKQNGILSHRSCPYTSQQNGRVERKHHHILDIVRALLISASLPKHFWG